MRRYVLSTVLPFPVSQHSPLSALDDAGLGVYGQGTLTFSEAWDVTVGARVDSERKTARLETFYTPPMAPPIGCRRRAHLLGRVAAGCAGLSASHRAVRRYASVARGFKAGGFNPASPPGSEAYGEEHAWNLEAGFKTTWANGRLSANAAVFHIVWDDMQLTCPEPAGAGAVLHRERRPVRTRAAWSSR